MNRLLIFILFIVVITLVMGKQTDGFENEGAIAGGVIGGLLVLIAFLYYMKVSIYKALSFSPF